MTTTARPSPSPTQSLTPNRDALIAELRASRDRVADLYRTLPPDALDVRVYDDGAQWTAKQVLAHLITIERTMPLLWKSLLAGTSAASSAEFDLERFNRAQPAKLDPLTIDELLARFDDVRAASIDRVAALGEDDLEHVGVHPFLGEGTLERFVAWAWVHADGHLADVRGAVAGVERDVRTVSARLPSPARVGRVNAATPSATAARRARTGTPAPDAAHRPASSSGSVG